MSASADAGAAPTTSNSTTPDPTTSDQSASRSGLGFFGAWRLAARFAWREMRGATRRFRVFLLCLALGVAGVAAVGSVVAAIEDGLGSRARELLGGDLAIELTYRGAEENERAAFERLGKVSEIYDARGVVRRPEDAATGRASDAAVAQLKAVDVHYPLTGAVVLDPPIGLAEALARGEGDVPGVVVEPAMATRLGLETGDIVRIGRQEFQLTALIIEEPDRAVSGIAFGPRALFSSAELDAAGLVQPGTLFETEYRIALEPGADLLGARAELEEAFPDNGWRLRDRRNGAPGVERTVGRLGAFLTLVGLAALAVGGVGVGSAVRSYLDGKTATIATLKTIGADGATVLRIYLIQIGVLALLGVLIGIVIGGALPLLFRDVLSENLPVPANLSIYARPLVEAGIYGVLTAFLFALWPIARARQIRAAGLFRDLVAPMRAAPTLGALAAMAALAGLTALAAVTFTGQATLALGFLGGVLAALLLLALAAFLAARLARWLARTALGRRSLSVRLALSSVAGPDGAGGGETRGAVLALGLGLTVLTAIGLLDVTLRSIVTDQLPKNAPAYFVIDIQNSDLDGFKAMVSEQEGLERIESAPMLRGVITRINGQTSREYLESGRVAEEYEWVLRGDRGVTYSAEPPRGSEITEGEWWPADYSGKPLVSFGAQQAEGLGLKLGDLVAVNVLGREIEAEIASFRSVEFRDGGINFLMVLDPGVLRGAPHAHIATLYGDETVPGAWLRAIAEAFPATTAVRVDEVLTRAESVLRQIAAAARAGASATLVTGLVVLIGAAASGRPRAIYEAAILKTLGATRAEILGAMTLRSALLGLAAGTVALGVGSAAAAIVAWTVFDARFVFDPLTAAAILGGGVLATLIAGALFAAGPLAARPARILRARE